MSLASEVGDTAPLSLADLEGLPPNIVAAIKAPSPASRALGLELLAVDTARGAVRMAFNAGEGLTNKWGGIQGGMVGAMLDDALAFAAGLGLEWGQIVPTLEMKVSFLEAARPGRLYAEGRVVRRGASTLFLESDLEDAAGTLLARASATARVVTLKKREAPAT